MTLYAINKMVYGTMMDYSVERVYATMSEHKEYMTRCDELGEIHISEEVLGSIAAAAALDVKGVSGLATTLSGDIAEFLGKRGTPRGVHITVEDDKVNVDLSILMTYGNTIPTIAKLVQEAVRTSMESMTGLSVDAININVGGIVFPPKGQPAAN